MVCSGRVAYWVAPDSALERYLNDQALGLDYLLDNPDPFQTLSNDNPMPYQG